MFLLEPEGSNRSTKFAALKSPSGTQYTILSAESQKGAIAIDFIQQ